MARRIAKKSARVSREAICGFLQEILDIPSVPDLSCNGLQVQGAGEIRRIGLAVDGCMETYRGAVENLCQMLIVHHGIIWGGLTAISGRTHAHIEFLLRHEMNLFAAHLPLDMHPELGNNARLAALLGIRQLRPFGNYKGTLIGFEGTLPAATTLDMVVERLCRKLDTSCTVLPFGAGRIRRIAVVSGGGAGELGEAVEKRLDCYITGEPSHENHHLALEAGINVVYAGHYHTEKPGVQALGAAIEKRFGVETVFLDVPTTI